MPSEDLLSGRYRLLQKTAEGGMGAVYEAFDTASGATVAVKTWRAHSRPDGRQRSRFRKEVEALARVRHPAIVRYVDHGESSDFGPFVVMEWVPGVTLAERIGTTGISPSGAIVLARRLAQGLSALHALGVVHRDVKPSNVLLPQHDPAAAILVDLGVARLSDATEATKTGGPIGTPRYMAPEQIRNGRSVSGKADVFALGCVLFECLTGRVAFGGGDPVSVLSRILFEPLPVPSAARPDLPPVFDGLLKRLLSRDPSTRPDAAELLDMLRDMGEVVYDLPLPAALPRTDPSTASLELEDETAADSEHEDARPPSFRAPFNIERKKPVFSFADEFIGREDLCDEIAGLLASGTRVVAVWGAAGVGKSRLVREAVERARSRGYSPWDVIVYADLESALDADDVVRIVAREAGVRPDSSEAPEVALGQALSRLGRVLLVLDPVDHVAPALAAALHVFARVAKDVQVLATSRARFAPPGAASIELHPLSTQKTGEAPSPAAALVLARVRPFLPKDSQSSQLGDRALAAENVATLLDGIPLAIELVASRVSVLGLQGLLDELEARRSGKLPSDPTLMGMADALDRSWVLLSPDEQRTLSACAVFRGGFTREAAAAVLDEPSMEHVRDRLSGLRDKSLLGSRDEVDGSLRLFLPFAVHDYATDKLAAMGDGAVYLERHAAYYARSFFSQPIRMDAAHVGRVEREAENLLSAAERGIAGEGAPTEDGLLALVALEPAVVARGALGTFAALLDRAVVAAESLGERARTPLLACRIRQIRAHLAAVSGRLPSARTDLERCREEATAAKDRVLLGSVLLDLGVTHHFSRDLKEARTLYEEALVLLRAGGDLGAEGRCIGNLGAIHHDEGALSLAARSYAHAIALLEQSGEVPRRANLIGNLALLEQELGRLDDARQNYERALKLLESLRNARLLGIALGNFALLELEAGNAAAAAAPAERSVRLLAGADVRSEALASARQAVVYTRTDRLGEADVAFAHAERLAKDSDVLVQETVSVALAFADLAWAERAMSRGSISEATELLSAVRVRLERARAAAPGERSASERSDDVRALERIIAPLVHALTVQTAEVR